MPRKPETQDADTLIVEDDEKSSARLLDAINKAERYFCQWQADCDAIDEIYARSEKQNGLEGIVDTDLDLFWASMEVLKPAVYAMPPIPVVAPKFNNRKPLYSTTSEFLERAITSDFDRASLDETMLNVRDDMIFYGRGVVWVTMEDEKGIQKVCIEHLDRKDFLHPPARKWSDVPWVARRAWMTLEEMRKRFHRYSGDAYETALLSVPSQGSERDSQSDQTKKAGVWEVWHKADNRVYWVCAGVPVILDQGEPHLNFEKFFPCPRPAFATKKNRTLLAIPDYLRYASHFAQINTLTRRIYGLLDQVRMKGLVPAGGDIAEALEALLQESNSATMLVSVPGMALSAGGPSGYVQWLPISEIAAAITGLIEARRQIIEDFYQLSGISDIMRGATEAQETLGAQRLKTQFGSVRVREKIDELQRIAADVTRLTGEVMAENFSQQSLLDMSLMDIPTKAEIADQVKELEDRAAEELRELARQAGDIAQQAEGAQLDPEQMQAAKQQFTAQQQEIIARYAPQIAALSKMVPIEDVMKLLRDDKARSFAFEVQTDSTIMTDEMAEKEGRIEFLSAFGSAIQAVQPLLMAGEEGAKLAGGMVKFAVAPFRAGRELDALIDEFVEAAPRLAERLREQQEGREDEGVTKLAEAELAKAQAQSENYQAQAALKQQELQLKAVEAAKRAEENEKRFQLEIEETRGRLEEIAARIEKIYADIQLSQQKLQLEAHREEREDVKTASDIRARSVDQDMRAQNANRDAAFRAQEAATRSRQDGREDY